MEIGELIKMLQKIRDEMLANNYNTVNKRISLDQPKKVDIIKGIENKRQGGIS